MTAETTPASATREVEHSINVYAPAREVYKLLAEVENWPRLFPPSVYVRQLEVDGNEERIQIWATANGEPKTWTSRRVLDPEALRITFWQELSTPPVAEMSGTWIIEPHDDHTKLRLLHSYRAIDNDPDGLAWIDKAVDDNSTAELPGLKAAVENAVHTGDLTISFVDSIEIVGSASDVFDFVDRADLWMERLPHVDTVELTEPTPGLQILRMDTKTKDGDTHTTESVRVTFPHHKIAYKQTALPALLDLHTGIWTFEEDDHGTTIASSQHTVILRADRITDILGAGAGVPEARSFIRNALGTNSLATLTHAKKYAEDRR
ncbi:aromatase/cyclase [Rhodococcus sp. IEGM 1330]|uniref:aromatase/cyclase n=1 Tax=Rhodococcus sp. IEGM 1330 TaxID=3082225 RepID=UPI002955A956|nr:aromatase/cyclase [Rhodococcus sp. IEGM 1330]MDV8022187.1 aromatase/cyclase [Rhodococcus sp. IEGM 1330]